MVNGILVDDGKRGRGDDVADAKLFTDGFDERGLAGPHLAVEGEHLVVAYVFNKLAGSLAYLSDVTDADCCHFAVLFAAKVGISCELANNKPRFFCIIQAFAPNIW